MQLEERMTLKQAIITGIFAASLLGISAVVSAESSIDDVPSTQSILATSRPVATSELKETHSDSTIAPAPTQMALNFNPDEILESSIPATYAQTTLYLNSDSISETTQLASTEGTIATAPAKLAAPTQMTLHFNPDDISEPSNMTLEQLKSFTEVYCTSWVGLEDYILAKDSEVNLIFLLSVGRMETWAGEACVGDYNCFNIRYDSGDYVDYTSYQASLDDFVRLITEEYLDPDGLWHEGTSIEAIGTHYAQPKWAPGITDLCYEIYDIINT